MGERIVTDTPRPVTDPAALLDVLARYHQAVAEATERAYNDLRRLGVMEPEALYLSAARKAPAAMGRRRR